MSSSLVIVESPAKAKTIKKYLGPGFTVKASVGHVMDLPKKNLGVDIEKNFEPTYLVLPTKKKVVEELRKEAAKAGRVYLAPDPDREGEAIAWHIAELLREKGYNQEIMRVFINEITKSAVQEAIENAGELDKNRYEAQQARRILDRLVGYQVSPLLWKKVQRGLSAGRVQSVALRIVCEREREIQNFKPMEYWTVDAELEGPEPPAFKARLVEMDGKKVEAGVVEDHDKKTYIRDKAGAEEVVQAVRNEKFIVSRINRREGKRNPLAPFITATLQQEAAKRLNFTAKKTMMIAQSLYEGVDLGSEGAVGLITYMRTDSTRINQQALAAVRNHIEKAFGKDYLPNKPNIFKTKKTAQEAHEAIRPTSMEYAPEKVAQYLDKDRMRLYTLIYNRFVASQMAPAIMDITSLDIPVKNYLFRASGSVIKFKGFLAAYEENSEDKEKAPKLPPLKQGQVLKLLQMLPEQHSTQPPPRFSESSLIKELEEKGIGRPSTYAQILSTIQGRKYVTKIKRNFQPTDLGFLINDILVQSFPDIFDTKFTARMEERLDEIEEGKLDWIKLLKDFYNIFEKDLLKAPEVISQIKTEVPTDLSCPECGRELVIKRGRHGEFLACSGYPECKYTSEFEKGENGEVTPVSRKPEPTDIACESCGKPMVIRKSRLGEFLGCSGYPKCKNTKNFQRTEDGGIEIVERKPEIQGTCDKCGKPMVIKRGRFGPFLACSGYPECKNIVSLKRKGGAKKGGGKKKA